MVPVDNETNLEVLRAYAKWLQTNVHDLASENLKLKNLAESSRQNWIDEKLKDQFSRLQTKFYGRGRESFEKGPRPVGHEEQLLLLHGSRAHDEAKKEERKPAPKPPREVRHGLHPDALEEESLLRGIPAGAAAWVEIEGLFQEHVEITVTERIYVETLHRQAKYRLKPEYSPEKETIITSPGPAKVRAGSRYSIDFAIASALDKYEYHVPLERQRRKMLSQGLEIDVKTLYGLCEAVGEHCESITGRIKQNILNDFTAAHLDETPWPILSASADNGQMWTVSNRIGSYYRFEPTRSGEIAEEMLKGYAGSIVVDGFAGYNRFKKLPEIRVGQCWSHARREFWDRRRDFPTETKEIIGLIDELMALEREAKSFESLKAIRQTRSKEKCAEIHAWLLAERPKHLKSAGLAGAIDYCLKYWPQLTAFLKDLSLPLTNNDAERGLRHAVMGRKNFGGSKTINGADLAASIYTVIESAKRVGLEPREYLKYLIEARWEEKMPLTPLELSLQKHGANPKIAFPQKSHWRIG
jgi:transposase